MIGIDTNILVRYLTQDFIPEAKLVEEFLVGYIGKEGSIFINNIVLCEVVWVLQSGYKYKKAEIVYVLRELLKTIEFVFENHTLLWNVVDEYASSSADFADIFIAQINKNNNCEYTITFDKKALKNIHFRSLNKS